MQTEIFTKNKKIIKPVTIVMMMQKKPVYIYFFKFLRSMKWVLENLMHMLN